MEHGSILRQANYGLWIAAPATLFGLTINSSRYCLSSNKIQLNKKPARLAGFSGFLKY